MSNLQDGSGSGIYAQRYDVSGIAVGGETCINTTTATDQAYPAITSLADGGYVVTWVDLDIQLPGGGSDIYAQRYDANNVAVGGETRINTTTGNENGVPALISLADGGYVVTWMSNLQDGSGSDIYAQRYDVSGIAVGGQTRINTTTANDQTDPAIAALADGGYVVTWMSYDKVYSMINGLTLAENVEEAIFFDPNVLFMVGNSLNNYFQGNDGANDIEGADGNDTIDGGLGNDTVDGGTGNDNLVGGSGADSLIGGDGVDVLNGGIGNDNLNGGTGDDTANYSSVSVNVTVNLGTGTSTGDGTDTLVSIEDVVGGSGADTITGSTASNDLAGGSGNDSLSGGDGLDILVGGAGTDTLNGGNGDDLADYSDTTTAVTVNLGTGTATGDGTDTLVSIEDALGGTGNDSLTGSIGNNELYGGGGNDYLYAGTGDDIVDGGDGNDIIVGGDGLGNDKYVGGLGIDTVRYASAVSTISVNLTTGLATGVNIGNDTLSGIENVIGGQTGDTIIGNALANTLDGYTGADTLLGGAGNDLYVVDNALDKVYETTTTTSTTDAGGMDQVNSTLGTYTLGTYVENGRITTTGAANLTGNSLSNTLYAGAGNNVLNGSTGTDTVSYQYGLVSGATLGVNVSLLLTTAQDTGRSGRDTLTSIENLTGSSLNDTLIGSAGNNVLDGGSGSDSLVGGLGNDTYVINTSNDIVVEDANAGTDTVNVLYSGYRRHRQPGQHSCADHRWLRI